MSWAQSNLKLLRDSNYVWVFLLFFHFWFFLAHFSLALECEVGSSPRRKELLRQRDLRSDRFFILSLTHEFLSPNSYDDLYDPEGTPRTFSPAHFLLPQMLLDPVLSQVVFGWLLFYFHWSQRGHVMNVPARPVLSQDETYVLMMLFCQLFTVFCCGYQCPLSHHLGSGKCDIQDRCPWTVPQLWLDTSMCDKHGKQRGTLTWRIGNFLWNFSMEEEELTVWINVLVNISCHPILPNINSGENKVLRHRPHYSEEQVNDLPASWNTILPRFWSHWVNCPRSSTALLSIPVLISGWLLLLRHRPYQSEEEVQATALRAKTPCCIKGKANCQM